MFSELHSAREILVASSLFLSLGVRKKKTFESGIHFKHFRSGDKKKEKSFSFRQENEFGIINGFSRGATWNENFAL